MNTTYLLITSDKPTELTAFVGPKKPIKKDILNNDEFVFVTDFGEWTKAMETAKASRLPVAHKLAEIGMHWFCTSEEFIFTDDKQKSTRVKIDTPVELEGWEPEIVYQEAYLSGEGEIWKKCSIDRFNNIRHLDCKRQAYRLKRSDPYLIIGAYNSDGNGNVTGGEIRVKEPVKQRACREICGDASCIHEGCAFTRNESPIEAKTQDSQEEMWMDVCVDTYAVEIIGVSKVITKLKEKFILTRRNP